MGSGRDATVGIWEGSLPDPNDRASRIPRMSRWNVASPLPPLSAVFQFSVADFHSVIPGLTMFCWRERGIMFVGLLSQTCLSRKQIPSRWIEFRFFNLNLSLIGSIAFH